MLGAVASRDNIVEATFSRESGERPIKGHKFRKGFGLDRRETGPAPFTFFSHTQEAAIPPSAQADGPLADFLWETTIKTD